MVTKGPRVILTKEDNFYHVFSPTFNGGSMITDFPYLNVNGAQSQALVKARRFANERADDLRASVEEKLQTN